MQLLTTTHKANKKMIETIAQTEIEVMQISIGWVLGAIITMATTVSTLAGIIYSSLKSQIQELKDDKDTQDNIIDGLQKDIDRLSRGCGLNGCHFVRRNK